MPGTFERVVEISLLIVGIYAVLGFLFALLFVARGVGRVDTQAHNAPLGFRLVIFPGVIAFWPLLLRRWISGVTEPPVEKDPHR